MDRIFAVWKPHVYKQKFKPGAAKWATFCLALYSIILCSPTFATIGLGGEDCFPGKHATDLLPPELIEWCTQGMTILVNVAIPFIGHLILDGLIVFKLKRAGTSSSLGRKEKDVTVSLLLVCVLYFITTSVTAINMAQYTNMEISNSRDVLIRRLLICGAVS